MLVTQSSLSLGPSKIAEAEIWFLFKLNVQMVWFQMSNDFFSDTQITPLRMFIIRQLVSTSSVCLHQATVQEHELVQKPSRNIVINLSVTLTGMFRLKTVWFRRKNKITRNLTTRRNIPADTNFRKFWNSWVFNSLGGSLDALMIT
jgi:hypothetical protein